MTDPAALASLAAGPKPAELRAELTRFNTTIADEYDHERLMARITGWGWKLALAASALCVVFGVRRRVGYSRRAPYSSGAVV